MKRYPSGAVLPGAGGAGTQGRYLPPSKQEGNHHPGKIQLQVCAGRYHVLPVVRTALPQAGMGERRNKEAGAAL